MAGVTNAVAGDVEPERRVARDRPVVRRVLALLIVASWVAWAVPTWQSTFHEVRAQELIADIEAKRVVGYLAVDDVRQPHDSVRLGVDVSWLFGFAPDYNVPASDVDGRPEDGPPNGLIYTIDGGRTRFAPDLAMGLSGRGDLFTDLRASGARPFRDLGGIPGRDWAPYPALLMVVLVIGSLVVQPPRRGTRPFWVLAATLFSGLGVLAYAVGELVAGPPSSAGPPPLRWMHGLGIAVIGGLLLPPVLRLLF